MRCSFYDPSPGHPSRCWTGEVPGQTSCQPPSPSLPSRAFSSTVLATMFSNSMLILSQVTAAAAHRAPGSPRRIQSQFILPKHRPPPPPTAQPRKKIQPSSSTFRRSRPVTVRTTPPLCSFSSFDSASYSSSPFFFCLFLLPLILRPGAAVREEEEPRTSNSVLKLLSKANGGTIQHIDGALTPTEVSLCTHFPSRSR